MAMMGMVFAHQHCSYAGYYSARPSARIRGGVRISHEDSVINPPVTGTPQWRHGTVFRNIRGKIRLLSKPEL